MTAASVLLLGAQWCFAGNLLGGHVGPDTPGRDNNAYTTAGYIFGQMGGSDWATVLARGRRADGIEFAIDVALGPAEFGGERSVVAIVRDFTVRERDHDELRYLSEDDALTGLLNRRGLDQQLSQAIAHARRHGVQTALMLLDLDNFKTINDRFAHREGDRLLCDVVQALRERLRADDTIARLGGDDFAVIAPFTTPTAAGVLATDLTRVVRETARAVVEDTAAVTASIGVVQLGGEAQDAIALIAAADAAMYEAKRAGGDSIRVAASAEDPVA